MIKRTLNRALQCALKMIAHSTSFNSLQSRNNAISLCKEEAQTLPNAVYLSKHIDRFLASSPFLSLENEKKRLFAKTTNHVPTLLIPYKSCYVFAGGILNSEREFMARHHKFYQSRKFEVLTNAVVVDSDVSANYFGHWLNDEMPASLIGNDSMPAIALHNALENYAHASDYVELFKSQTKYGFNGIVKNLFLLVDFSQNSHKQHRHNLLRGIMGSKNLKSSIYNGAYIARGSLGKARQLENEAELIDYLVKIHNFDIIYPEHMSAIQIVERLWNIPLVISIEGSAISHAIYTIAPIGGILVLQPPRRICHVFKGILDARNNPYGFYVCKPSENEKDSFYLDSFSDLDKLIDLLREESLRRSKTSH